MRISLLLSIVCIIVLSDCNQKPDSGTEAGTNSSQEEARKITSDAIKTGSGFSTPVISYAQKFIIPVPAFGRRGEPLVYPKGAEKAGQPIVDYQGKPIGDRGLVFFNAKDKSWQAVKGDGNGVIIINEVTQEQAARLYAMVAEIKKNPEDLSLSELKQVLETAQSQLGLTDMYNSTRDYIKEKMTPLAVDKTSGNTSGTHAAYGLMKRDDRDINQAVYIPGKFEFEGPAASLQKFEDGGVIVEQGGKMRGVQPDIFLRTYRLSDGSPISSLATDIKTFTNSSE